MTKDRDAFTRVTGDYEAWLKKNGVWMNENVRIADLRAEGRGRGMVAKANIKREEKLFQVPRRLILSSYTTSLPKEYTESLGVRNHWLRMVLAMLYEKALGPKSKWAPYLATLPSRFETLIWWSEEELKELQGCHILNQIGKGEMDSRFTSQLAPIIMEHPQEFGFETGGPAELDDLLKRCHQCGSALMSYGFDIEYLPEQKPKTGKRKRREKSDEESSESSGSEEDDGRPSPTMSVFVPLADTLNADEDHNAELVYEKDYLIMRTTKRIERGREILNTYGSLDRSTVLRRYGYITPGYAVNDFVLIPGTLFIKSVKKLYKLADAHIEWWLDKYGYNEKGDDSFEALCEPFDFVLDLEFVESETLDVTRFKREFHLMNLVPVAKRQKNYKPKNFWWSHWMINTLEDKLGEYSTTLKDDVQMLKKEGDVMGIRKRMALEVRIGEKEILEGVVKKLKQWQQY